MSSSRPLLIVVSAPSGAGKTTLCELLLAARPDTVYSVSCTTRAPRGAEVDGEDYFFLSEDVFLDRLEQGAFLEHAVVHGFRYGTLVATVRDALRDGCSVLMDIDVQGAAQIRNYAAAAGTDDPIHDGFVDIFIAPPSLDALRARLEGRGEDAPDVIQRRLDNAAREMDSAPLYRYVVVNDDLDAAAARLIGIVNEESKRP